MHIELVHGGHKYTADLNSGISLASPLGIPEKEFKAWSSPFVDVSPVRRGEWIGSVEKGAPVNFYDISLNPHGNGTHTEGRGHITREHHSLNQSLRSYHFVCRFVRVAPVELNGDAVITLESLKNSWQPQGEQAIIVATGNFQPGHDFSGTNPAYFEPEVLRYLRENEVAHFLTDLPSVDKEEDGGLLSAHHAFWPEGDSFSNSATISEMLAIPADLPDGLYLLNMQVPAIENDAAPSRPVVFPLQD